MYISSNSGYTSIPVRADGEWNTGSLHTGVSAQLSNVCVQSVISIHLSWRLAWS